MADSSDFSGSDAEAEDIFLLHDAAAAGDVESLRQLLEQRTAHLQQQMDVDSEAATAQQLLPDDDPYLQAKDQNECTPLHIAILQGRVECAQLLVQAQASVCVDCDGCPCLHMATCTGALPEREAAALQLVKMLLEAGADSIQRDDCGRLALHWSAELGLAEVCQLLLQATTEAAAALTARVAAAAADAETGEEQPMLEMPNLLEMQDNNGDNVLHVAARFNQAAVLQLLLSQDSFDPADAAVTKNKQSFTPLAAAAFFGAAAAAPLLLQAHAAALSVPDKHGFTPADLAERRGHKALAARLRSAAAAAAEAAAAGPAAANHAAAAAAAAGSNAAGMDSTVKQLPTLIVAPPECELHRTCPDPLPRGCHPPPENVDRIRVLSQEGRGILHSRGLQQRLSWELSVPPAPISDVLRVHDWNYVRGLQLACQAIPDRPDAQAHLDPDTAVSHHTFHVALRAASAVCVAIDRVIRGQAANAFCVVRPPGHHAGPRGIVPSKKDRTGSHGFCLLNNVAIGAAYAMNVHRHAGIQRVAILDFDVHHGNGTRACVSNTAPGTLRVPFTTPLSEGVHVYHTYQPWFDVDDDDNVLFASVQGYGPKAASMPDVFVYPGSGATCDTQELKVAQEKGQLVQEKAATAAAAAAPVGNRANGIVPAGAGEQQVKQEQPAAGDTDTSHMVDEDPHREFLSTTADDPVLSGPRIVDVGIPGPGFHPLLWRRAWRDKVLPALVNFNPDLILVSAGFDAHRKDEINFRYIGVTEADYEWITDEIVQVANRCCNGRVVSVLEGGYNINGGIVSAFARSVAAHVRGLAEPHSQAWDPQEPHIERETERRRQQERAAKAAAKRAAALERQKRAIAMAAATAVHGDAAAAAAAVAAAKGGAAAGGGVRGDKGAAAAAAAASEEASAEPAEGRSKRRRAGAVDYAALNAQLEAEAAAAHKSLDA
ncbi:Arginase/deacetylase [Scenedesmus sp. NREL 46B-D3]|nr:Arginase/deacetylase [Scenedesmus sp. NREL 46B-D3]